MQIVLLSGGSGKRLWPLSNDVRSKQFLKLLVDENGERQSMVQRVYRQIKTIYPYSDIVVATGASQVGIIRSQLAENVEIVLEPERRDTFPAIVLACIYLALEKGVGLDEPVIILPIDSYTEAGFYHVLNKMEKAVSCNDADIVLMGIRPTIPTSKYGYILSGHEISEGIYSVSRFVEKPDEQTAAKLINENASWNSGVFAFSLGYLMEIAHKQFSFSSFAEAFEHYGELEKTSFDFKVVEKAERVAMAHFGGMWTDVGTWRTLADEMTEHILGTAIVESSKNTYVINELSIPLVALGTEDLIIAASPDGILVSNLFESSQLKLVLDKLEDMCPMCGEQSWGEYTVVKKADYKNAESSLIKYLTIFKGKCIGYCLHRHRDEVWTIINGDCEFVLDGVTRRASAGDVLRIKRGQKHDIFALSDLHIAEVQLGYPLLEDDMETFEWEWENG